MTYWQAIGYLRAIPYLLQVGETVADAKPEDKKTFTAEELLGQGVMGRG